MKIKELMIAVVVSLGLIACAYAGKKQKSKIPEDPTVLHQVTFIKLNSQPNSQPDLEKFLKDNAKIVRQTEPTTPFWFALKDESQFAIVDVFFNEAGRTQHFAGQVAHALKEIAPKLIQGGWENGVVTNANNFEIVAYNNFAKDKVLQSKEATYIVFKAKPGRTHALELLLKEGAKLVNDTEAQTYFWLGMKLGKNTFAIFDAFPDKSAQKTHLEGKVAEILQKSADKNIIGGWEKGVVDNIKNYQIVDVS